MPSILCLGAGLVTGPGIQYLAQAGFPVTVASRTVAKAEKIIEGLPNCTAVALDIAADPAKLEELVQSHDLIISLLPWTEHMVPAKLALKHRKNFCTTSYISDAMQELDADFRAAGIVSLNECGVDPGLDHMSAMKIIHKAHEEGGKVLSFTSYCGGLPCPDDNNNPFGYKFSWFPRGVLLAATRRAVFLEDGKQVELDGSPGHTIYDHVHDDTTVPNVGPKLETEWPSAFECYPNGDSEKFVEIYGIPEVQTLIRGTYRYLGWCPTMKKVADLGLLKEDDIADLKGKSYAELLASKVGGAAADVKATTAAKLGLAVDDAIVGRMEWLGLFDAERKVEASTTLDALVDLFLKNPKLWYEAGERDMLCMHHTFVIEKADGAKERLTSTMIDYGTKDGDTSMSRTVSLPLAIMVRRILSGEVTLTGVVRPITPELYTPILDEMEAKFGIRFVETATPL
jgi:saccharopine dehydrogenase (NADP+, L-glutamate forming)